MAKRRRRIGDGRTGIGVDAYGAPVVDPTKNVLDLVGAETNRQNDLRDMETKWRDQIDEVRVRCAAQVTEAHAELDKKREEHGKELAGLHADFDDKIHDIETKQADKAEMILRESLRDSKQERKESLDAVVVTMQNGLDKAERQLQIALQDAEKRVNDKFNPLLDRLAALEKLAAQGEGRQRVEDPQMAAFVNRMEAVANAIQNNAGVNKGIGISWGAIVGAGSLVVALILGVNFISSFGHSTAAPSPAPQVVYVPAAPGTMLPTTPQQVPR